MDEHHDHCDHDLIECSYDALVGEYQEAVAERDRLRAALEVLTECQTCGMVARLALDGHLTLDVSADIGGDEEADHG